MSLWLSSEIYAGDGREPMKVDYLIILVNLCLFLNGKLNSRILVTFNAKIRVVMTKGC